jgi:hypothetical protein
MGLQKKKKKKKKKENRNEICVFIAQLSKMWHDFRTLIDIPHYWYQKFEKLTDFRVW